MKIDIIGAGPAGSYTAYLLAKNGYKVHVYERSSLIGSPVQCTGILSNYFSTILQPNKEYIINTITKTRIYAPNGRFITAKIKKNYVICRKKFDNYLADLATKAGAKYYLNHSFNQFKENKKIISQINAKNKQISSEADILIGADGPLSKVAKQAELFQDREFVYGTQIETELRNDNSVEFYPYIGCYAWIVPLNSKRVRIGVVAYKKVQSIFRQFAQEKLGKNYKIIENQSGVIPVFNPSVKTQKNNVYVVGDAATFVKASTGGGINQSLLGAKALVESISDRKNYQRMWRKRLFKKLYMHLLLHKVLQKFSEKDWNYLIKVFSEPKMKYILYSESRDQILKMIFKTAITKPSLIKYVKYFPFEDYSHFIKFS
jgi:geranylgeranyl reductase family protein